MADFIDFYNHRRYHEGLDSSPHRGTMSTEAGQLHAGLSYSGGT